MPKLEDAYGIKLTQKPKISRQNLAEILNQNGRLQKLREKEVKIQISADGRKLYATSNNRKVLEEDEEATKLIEEVKETLKGLLEKEKVKSKENPKKESEEGIEK